MSSPEKPQEKVAAGESCCPIDDGGRCCEPPQSPRSAQTGLCPGAPNIPSWIVGWIDTFVGPVPQVATGLTRADRLGAVRVRLTIRRMDYAVPPGLYAVGSPTPESPVFVSANYKLSFDRLRKELAGLDGWILVLDTRGINVWCAAGGGTFGTDEIVARVEAVGLGRVVSHRRLIVPQLGAPGVAAHQVKRRSGFSVVYGPVRAKDIPAFLGAGMKATPAMRRVRFDLPDRLVIVPVELAQWGRYVIGLMAVLFLLGGFHRGGYDLSLAAAGGLRAALLTGLAFAGGGVLMPVLLPWLPGRSFSVKGAAVGVVLAGGVWAMGWVATAGAAAMLETVCWFLLLPAISAFVAMNYTGASTFTSLSGVRREMRFAVPAQAAAGAIGLGLWFAARFVSASPAAGIGS